MVYVENEIKNAEEWIERLRIVEQFTEEEDGFHVTIHSHTRSFSVVVSGDKDLGLEKLHQARQWLRSNLGNWEDKVSRVSKVGDSVFVEFEGPHPFIGLTWITKDDEAIKLFVSDKCKFVDRADPGYFKDLVCSAS